MLLCYVNCIVSAQSPTQCVRMLAAPPLPRPYIPRSAHQGRSRCQCLAQVRGIIRSDNISSIAFAAAEGVFHLVSHSFVLFLLVTRLTVVVVGIQSHDVPVCQLHSLQYGPTFWSTRWRYSYLVNTATEHNQWQLTAWDSSRTCNIKFLDQQPRCQTAFHGEQ